MSTRQLLRTAAAVGKHAEAARISTLPRRHLQHAASGPSRQAAIVNRQTERLNESDLSTTPILALQSNRIESEPLQTIDDATSNSIIRVYPRTISLQCPKYGLVDEYHFDHIWLRDICTEANSVQQDTKQKLFHTSDIHMPPSNSKLGLLNSTESVRLLRSEGDLPILQLTFDPKVAVVNAFSQELSSAPPADVNPHISHIPISILLEHAVPELYNASHGDIGGAAQAWKSSDLSTFPPSRKPESSKQAQTSEMDPQGAFARPSRISWGAFLGDQGKALDAEFALVDGLMRDGIAFVTELPTDKTGSAIDSRDADSPSLARFAEMLGEIRHTFYGSLWDVRSLGSSSRNIAYTNLDLGLHMDLCYFQNPPRFQLLHMLRNRVKGGASIFVDSYKVAEEMWKDHRDLWQVLTEVPVGFHYQNDGRYYRYTHPIFELASSSSGHASALTSRSSMPRLTAVNYSPPFQSPLPLHPSMQREKLGKFFQALQVFSSLTLHPKYRYERTLVEGECVVFDNRRVLHSRRGFEWSEGEEKSDDDVKRWLKGCYIDGDAVWSTYRTLLARSHGGKLGLQ